MSHFVLKIQKNKACLTCVFFKRRRRLSHETSFSRGDIYECSKLNINFFRTHDYKRVNEDLTTHNVEMEVSEQIFGGNKKMIFPKRDCELYKKKIN